MSMYLTLNPVPSKDPRDLDDNAVVFDQLLNSNIPSVADRLNVLRKTWWQMEQDAAALVAPNVSALAALVGAANKGFYFTGPAAMSTFDLTAQGRTFLAATTQALQRTALQLGSASLLAAVTGPTDVTASRALTVGYGGLGAPIPVTDANLATTGGFCFRLNSPYTNGPTAGPYSIMPMAYDNEVSQLAFQEGGTSPVVFYRKRTGPSTWGGWERSAKADAAGIVPIAQGGTGLGAQAFANLTLQNSWTVVAARRAAYRKIMDNVQLEMQITGGTATNGTLLFTLPAGFRPAFNQSLPCLSGPAVTPSSSQLGPYLTFATDGTVVCFNCSSASGIYFSGLLPLV